MFYFIVVLMGTVLVSLTNFFALDLRTFGAFIEILFAVIVGDTMLFLIDAVTAFLVRRLPENGLRRKQGSLP